MHKKLLRKVGDDLDFLKKYDPETYKRGERSLTKMEHGLAHHKRDLTRLKA